MRQVLAHFTGSSTETAQLNYHLTQLLGSEDVRWLIDLYDEVDDEVQQRVLSNLVRRIFDRADTSQTDAIIVAARKYSALAEEFAWLLKPVELRSEMAEQLKAEYLEEQKWSEEKEKGPILESPADREDSPTLGQV